MMTLEFICDITTIVVMLGGVCWIRVALIMSHVAWWVERSLLAGSSLLDHVIDLQNHLCHLGGKQVLLLFANKSFVHILVTHIWYQQT
jgi:hypothetical protein